MNHEIITGTWADALRRNEELVENGQPFVFAGSAAGGSVVGPLVLPGQTPCLACLEIMIDLGAVDSRFIPADAHAQHAEDALRAFLAAHDPSQLLGTMWLVDANGNAVASMRLVRFPSCTGCHPRQHPAEVYYASQLFHTETARS